MANLPGKEGGLVSQPRLPTLWFWPPCLQNCEKINLCCPSHSVCGICYGNPMKLIQGVSLPARCLLNILLKRRLGANFQGSVCGWLSCAPRVTSGAPGARNSLPKSHTRTEPRFSLAQKILLLKRTFVWYIFCICQWFRKPTMSEWFSKPTMSETMHRMCYKGKMDKYYYWWRNGWECKECKRYTSFHAVQGVS